MQRKQASRVLEQKQISNSRKITKLQQQVAKLTYQNERVEDANLNLHYDLAALKAANFNLEKRLLEERKQHAKTKSSHVLTAELFVRETGFRRQAQEQLALTQFVLHREREEHALDKLRLAQARSLLDGAVMLLKEEQNARMKAEHQLKLSVVMPAAHALGLNRVQNELQNRGRQVSQIQQDLPQEIKLIQQDQKSVTQTPANSRNVSRTPSPVQNGMFSGALRELKVDISSPKTMSPVDEADAVLVDGISSSRARQFAALNIPSAGNAVISDATHRRSKSR